MAAPITNLRSSVTDARVRFVLDSTAPIAFNVKQDKRGIVVDLTDSFAKQTTAIIKDAVVKGATLDPTTKKSGRLVISLAKTSEYKIFKLENPHRLVIDVYRISIFKRKQNIADGVDYTFEQNELNGKPFQAHIVEIDKDANYGLVPFSCAGAYNGRGSLLKESNNRRLIVAINSSYFDSDGWVIGNTKHNGMFISSDYNTRSGYGSYGKHNFIFKDLIYQGMINLPNGRQIELKGMNRLRIKDDLVLYNEHFGPSTKTNEWGREIKIKNGRVIEINDRGNMKIEPGTYVISAHGVAKGYFVGVKNGDKISVTETLGNSQADQMKTVVTGGPLLIENGYVNVRVKEEKIPGDIANGRSPRTALGLKKDGSIILLVVDGRSESSCGMTLTELANYLIKLGAFEALNFDGGGSSEMVINGRIVNKPSDGRERLISMGLGLLRN